MGTRRADASGPDPDGALMLRVRDGDREAFRELYERHSAGVVRYANGFTRSAARAEELAQEVFLQVYRARDRYERRARFTTWLYTIAHNLCLNEVRRFEYRGKTESLGGPRGEDPANQEPADENPAEGEAVATSRELEARLRDLLGLLPDQQRTALLLSRVQGMRYEEIGQVLGCSEQAVKSLIFRATQRLKEGLKDWVQNEQ